MFSTPSYHARILPKLLLLLLPLSFFLPTNSWAEAVPAPSKPALSKKYPYKNRWSFRPPTHRLSTITAKTTTVKNCPPQRIHCEGPDMAGTIGIFGILLLIWAIPTGVLVLLGLLFSVTWLWILGLVLFALPIVLFLILIIGMAFN